jgi:hypothetical protein
MMAASMIDAERAGRVLGASAHRFTEFAGFREIARVGSLKPAKGDPLVDLAALLEPDGGMPGSSDAERAVRSIAALLAFLAAGNMEASGAFRLHVARLVAFLRGRRPASKNERLLIEKALQAASAGRSLAGDWLALASNPRARWKDLENVL